MIVKIKLSAGGQKRGHLQGKSHTGLGTHWTTSAVDANCPEAHGDMLVSNRGNLWEKSIRQEPGAACLDTSNGETQQHAGS